MSNASYLRKGLRFWRRFYARAIAQDKAALNNILVRLCVVADKLDTCIVEMTTSMSRAMMDVSEQAEQALNALRDASYSARSRLSTRAPMKVLEDAADAAAAEADWLRAASAAFRRGLHIPVLWQYSLVLHLPQTLYLPPAPLREFPPARILDADCMRVCTLELLKFQNCSDSLYSPYWFKRTQAKCITFHLHDATDKPAPGFDLSALRISIDGFTLDCVIYDDWYRATCSQMPRSSFDMPDFCEVLFAHATSALRVPFKVTTENCSYKIVSAR